MVWINFGEDGKIVGECIVCGALTLKKCSKCKVVFFCDKDHQKMDWLNNEAHRKKCGTGKKKGYKPKKNGGKKREEDFSRRIKYLFN